MLCMIFCIGGGSVAFAAEGEVFYSLTAVKTNNQVYATYYDVTINNLVWNVPGNQSLGDFWRIGGKDLKKVDRYITGKSPIEKAIGKVTLNHNGKSNANLTINSISLTVASDASFTHIIETVTKKSPNISASIAGSIDFEPSNGAWAENSYYKLTINVSNSNTTNYGLDFTSMVFYEGATGSTTTDPSSNLTLSQPTGEVNVDKTLDISDYVTTADGYIGTVTYAVTEGEEYASVSEAGVITGLAVGTATIKVTAPAIVGSFSESSAEFTVTVKDNRTATTVTFGEDVDNRTFSVNLGETFIGKTATISPDAAGDVTYSSDNTEVASVDENTGAITLGRIAGKATITASFAETATHKASSAKYYINVIDPNALVFYESFCQNEGQGGNDGIWKGISKMPTLKYDNSGWTVKNESGANKCARFGIINAKGTATTPTIDLSGDKYILTFKAGAWSGDKTTIDVIISDGTLTYNGTENSCQTIEMNKAEWTDYTMTIAGATNSTTITFTAKVASYNRFFLDEVKIVEAQRPEPTASGDLTFKAQDSDGMYYATFSSDKDVVFTKDVIVSAVSVADNKLSIKNLTPDYYKVTDSTVGEGTGIVEDGYYVPKNNGVLISCTDASTKYYFPKAEQTNVALTANQLKAAPAEGGEFNAEAGYKYYKLAYDDYDAKTGLGFYRGAADGGAFSVKAGTAYLAVPSTSETNNVKGFSFDGTSTGVSAVDAEEPAKTRVIYNIAGQKVNAMTKAGLYIVNGKKIVIRK